MKKNASHLETMTHFTLVHFCVTFYSKNKYCIRIAFEPGFSYMTQINRDFVLPMTITFMIFKERIDEAASFTLKLFLTKQHGY